MQKPELTLKWACGLCGKWCLHESDADDHCPRPRAYEVFTCSDAKCEWFSLDKDDFEDHLETHLAYIEFEDSAREAYLNELRFPTGKFTLNAECAVFGCLQVLSWLHNLGNLMLF